MHAIATAALGLLIPSALAAQVVRGTVVDRANAPVRGVVVLLLNERDSVESRALSNDRGEYRVIAGKSGTYRLRSLRIGFRPITSTTFSLTAGEEVTRQLILTGVPFSLDTVRVSGRAVCGAPSDSAAATYAIWEQVRTALTATQLTAGSRGIGATFVTYDRSLDLDRGRVVSQHSSVSSGLTRTLWTSPSVDSLRRAGYIVSDVGGATTTYYGPDLRVLLSDAFIEDHCFGLVTSRDRNQIGIAFEPTRERRRVPGIHGTLWLDRRSSELRRMEFRYTNATRQQESGRAGGNIQFARTTSGAWLISSWSIRMPVLHLREVRAQSTNWRSQATRREIQVTGIRVEGGELSVVTTGADTLWTHPPLVLTGTILDSTSGRGVAAARVALRGTSLHAVSDASGRFRISGVLPGEYIVDVQTPSLKRMGAVHTMPLTLTDSATVFSARVPTGEQVAHSLCPRTTDGIIAGTVLQTWDTLPPRDAQVAAQWNERSLTADRYGAVETRPDARGAFRLCGIPIGVPIRVDARTKDVGSPPLDVRIPRGSRVAMVELTLDDKLPRLAVLSGVVLSDVNGAPIPDVQVSIPSLSKVVFTSDSGRYRLSEIPAGTYEVSIRRVGYRAWTDSVSFLAGATVERRILLSRVLILDTIAVTESAVLPDFEEHRRLGLGKFLTRADLEKLKGAPLGATLNQMQTVYIRFGRNNQAWIASKHVPAPESRVWCPDGADKMRGLVCGCYPLVYLDRMIISTTDRGGATEPFDVNRVPSASIEAIEWYGGPASTPIKYSTLNSACGVLVIHTRRSP